MWCCHQCWSVVLGTLNHVRLGISQLGILLQVEVVGLRRRLWQSVTAFLLPIIAFVLFASAAYMCPSTSMEAFQYLNLPVVGPDVRVPNESLVSYHWETDVAAVGGWRDVFNQMNFSYFFIHHVLALAALSDVGHESTWPTIAAAGGTAALPTVNWTQQEIAQTLLSNRRAALPFKVPTFDEYISMITATKRELGVRGMKHTMHSVPLVRFIMQFGSVAFALSDDSGDHGFRCGEGCSAHSQLLEETEKLVEYLNATTNTFELTVACPSDFINTTESGCVFASVHRALELISASNKTGAGLWAIVRMDRVRTQPPELHYTILANREAIQADTVNKIEPFPQGLGREYANFAYSGVLTLQYEINSYFISRTRPSQQVAQNLSLTPLVNTICSAVKTQHNATREAFDEPVEEHQRKYVATAAAAQPLRTITAEAFTDLYAVYAPCLYEVTAFCDDVRDSEALVTCLEEKLNLSIESSGVCAKAVRLIRQCIHPDNSCENQTAYELLTRVPSALPRCSASVASTCSERSFSHAVERTMRVNRCPSELRSVCLGGSGSQDAFHVCLHPSPAAAANLSDDCRAVLEAFLPCSDEFLSICPTKSLEEEESIPFACLYANYMFLSDRCRATRLLNDLLPAMYGQRAVLRKIPAPTYYCRMVHDVYKTLHNSVVAQAFPTKGYVQQSFFVSLCPLLGLVLSAAYYFPFAETARSIARERERLQHKYLVISGVHPAVTLLSKFILASIASFFVSIIVALTAQLMFHFRAVAMFSLLFLYSISMNAMAVLVGLLFPCERLAATVSLFVIFFSLVAALTTSGVSSVSLDTLSLFPPVVLAGAVNEYTRAARSEFMAVIETQSSQRAWWILLCLTVAYGRIAIILEFLLAPHTVIRRVLHVITALFSWAQLCLSRYWCRSVTSDCCETGHSLLCTNDSPSHSSSKRWRTRNRGQERGHEGLVAPRFSGRNGEGVGKCATEWGACPEPRSSTVSCVKAEAAMNSVPEVPLSWNPMITIRDLVCTPTWSSDGLRISSASFYHDRLNCVVGAAASGKDLLLEVLMGWCEWQHGDVQVNNVSLRSLKGVECGICMDRTVIWDFLTVSEHIRLMQSLKVGSALWSDTEKREEEDILISALQLGEVRDQPAGLLNAAVARKLAVCMALAGSSRIVILCEPTVGMDSFSKGAVWRLLAESRSDRCVIVSSGDVAWMNRYADHFTHLHEGRLFFAGTPEYVRHCSGGGWNVSACLTANASATAVVSCVTAVVPEVVIVRSVGHEVCFRLSEDTAMTSLPVLLSALQQARGTSLITTISVSDAYLSESLYGLLPAGSYCHSERVQGESAVDVTQTHHQYHKEVPLVERSPCGSAVDQLSNDVGSVGGTVTCEGTLGAVYSSDGRNALLSDYRSILVHRLLEVMPTSFCASCLAVALLGTGLFALGVLLAENPTRDYPATKVTPLRDWRLSSKVSTTIFTDFAAASSPYAEMLAKLKGMALPGTRSLLWNLSIEEENSSLEERSSAALDAFLRNRSLPAGSYTFGAFALQGPFAQVLSAGNTTHPKVFPWVADIVLHNTSFPISLASFVEILSVLRLWVASNNTEGSILSQVGVLPVGSEEAGQTANCVQALMAVLILLTFALQGGHMAFYLVRQRESGYLRVLYTTHLQPVAFWVANFTFDLTSCVALLVPLLLLHVSCTYTQATGCGSFFEHLLTLVIYGAVNASMSYVLSTLFRSPIAAQTAVTNLNVFSASAVLAAYLAVEIIPDTPLIVLAKVKMAMWARFFRALPLFALAEMLVTQNTAQKVTMHPSFGTHAWLLMFPVLLLVVILCESLVKSRFNVVPEGGAARFLGYKMYEALVMPRHLKRSYWFFNSGHEAVRCRACARRTSTDDFASSAEERLDAPCSNGLCVKCFRKGYYCNGGTLRELSLNVAGKTTAVVGANGSGKTTFLSSMANCAALQRGSGIASTYRAADTTDFRGRMRTAVGYAPQALIFQDSALTPLAFLKTMAELRGLSHNAHRNGHLHALLHTLGLVPYMHMGMWTLSVSVKRRLALAAALVGYPSVLILDGVTDVMDPLSRQHVWRAIQRIPPDTTILLSTLNPEDVQTLGDCALCVDKGVVQSLETPVVWRDRHWSGLVVSIALANTFLTRHGQSELESHLKALVRFVAAHWADAFLVDSQHLHCVFHIPLLGDASEPRRHEQCSIYIVLTTLIRGRSMHWKLDDEVDISTYDDGKIHRSDSEVDCFITVAEAAGI